MAEVLSVIQLGELRADLRAEAQGIGKSVGVEVDCFSCKAGELYGQLNHVFIALEGICLFNLDRNRISASNCQVHILLELNYSIFALCIFIYSKIAA